MKKKSLNTPASGVGIAISVNLVVSPVKIEPVAAIVFKPAAIAIPIMREGFITQTGLLAARNPNNINTSR